MAQRIDQHGGATVLVGSLNEVEAAGRAILGYGSDPVVPRSDGPTAVRVEPAE